MSVEPRTSVAEAVTLADFTNPELILPDLRERDAAGAISVLSHILQREGCVPDVLPFYHAALNQELLTTSALDSGIALPHARLHGIRQLRFAFGRAPVPVAWGPRGSFPADLIFLLAVPATDAAQYLNLLASLARLALRPDLTAELRKGGDSATLLATLERIRIRQG